MINGIKHFALTSFPTIHDEEALTTLELVGRITAKINECIKEMNQHTEQLMEELDKLPGYAADSVKDNIDDGTIYDLLNDTLMGELRVNLDSLHKRIDNIVANANETDGNSELVDTRVGANGVTYTSAGDHLREIATGAALVDAVRPGVVKEERIMPGMLGGDMTGLYTHLYNIPLAGLWTNGTGYYDAQTLDRVDHSGYNISAPIPCEYGDMFKLTSYLFGPLVRPAAVLDKYLKCVEVIGTGGRSDWEPFDEVVSVSHPDAAFICFVVGTGYVSQFRARRYSAVIPGDAAKNARGYWHMHARRRIDTVTDRAQIKCWYSLESIGTHAPIVLPMRLGNFDNLKGWTFRVFAATSDSTYDIQMMESASGYTYDPSEGIRIYIKDMPEATTEGIPITHLALFIDFLPEDDRMDEYMDVELIQPLANGVYPSSAELHGAVDTDYMNNVPANASASFLYRRKLLTLGDSLMSGNTLKKHDSWVNIIGDFRDMDYYNAGLNGSPIAPASDPNAPASMLARIDAAMVYMPDPDYFILTGGANDKRLSVKLPDFRAAITTIIEKVRTRAPRCKILMGTNWRRTKDANSLGLYDVDYVQAMLEVAETLGVPCVNNFLEGLDLTDPATAAWADEGIVTGGTANLHFSKAANVAIAEKYVGELERI